MIAGRKNSPTIPIKKMVGAFPSFPFSIPLRIGWFADLIGLDFLNFHVIYKMVIPIPPKNIVQSTGVTKPPMNPKTVRR
jgi:hypothetical protein